MMGHKKKNLKLFFIWTKERYFLYFSFSFNKIKEYVPPLHIFVAIFKVQ